MEEMEGTPPPSGEFFWCSDKEPRFLPSGFHKTACERSHGFYKFSLINQKKHPVFGISWRANGLEKSKKKIPSCHTLNFYCSVRVEWMKFGDFFSSPCY